MKTREFEKILIGVGFFLVRKSKHKIWSNGTLSVAIPHNRMLNRTIAKKILKQIEYTVSVGELGYEP